MYDRPSLNMYEDAILRNGDPKSYTFTGGPRLRALRFPATIGGATIPKQGIARRRDFKTQWALLSNIQIERALSDDISASLGYINSSPQHAGGARHEPDRPPRPSATAVPSTLHAAQHPFNAIDVAPVHRRAPTP